MSVVIETTIGDITVDLFTAERPVACLNFVKLCKLKYYNFNLFHTVEQGFIAQTGDPTGAGNGGSSVWGVVEGAHKRFFEAESLPKIYHSSAGLLSLVSAGKNLSASQFFFTLGANLTSLDGVHCVIGEVVEGHDTLRRLNEAIVDENFRPYQDIRITHTVVLEDPFSDPRGYREPSRSPSPSAERLKNGRIGADEDIDDTDGKTMQEIQEMLADREAKARATILEIVGDLPDADMAPPENVLFVCKLNPVTSDDDLEIIFSRFGIVKSCEVIRDRKSGDSLQYAFVEFEDKKSCEAAYFKMDNVLIDDRRIHVDFSQSVSRVKWRGKGRGVEGPDGRLDFNNLRDNGESGHRKGPQQRERTAGSERSRMASEERRREREKRHRLQRDQEEERSRRSSHYKNNNRQADTRRQSEQRPAHNNWNRNEQRRRQSRSRSRDRSRQQSRSRSRERARRRDSPDRRHSTQQRHNERRDNAKHGEQRNRNIDARRERSVERTKPNGHRASHKRHSTSKETAKRSKKSKRKQESSTSESEDESDSSIETESDSTTSESSSVDSSDDSSSKERRKKKKTKDKKSHKSKSSKKKRKNRR